MGEPALSLAVKPMRKPDLSWKGIYELERWLGNKKPSSLKGSFGAWKRFKAFVEEELGKTFTDAELAKYLIDEIEKDQKQPARLKGEPQRRITRFYGATIQQGASRNYAKTQIGSIMAFYRENGFKIHFTRRFSDLFPSGGKPENRKQLVTPSDLKEMLDNARSLRDRAIMLTLFEGGMDIATLKSINVGQVADVELPETKFLTIHLRREKEQWDYFTHLGFNAIEAIRRYLSERRVNLKRRGVSLKDGDPLFVKEWVKEGKHSRITSRCVEKAVRDVATRSGLLNTATLKEGQLAPIRPYSLRGSFSTLLENDKCPYNYREFWQGHKIRYGGAYFTPSEQLSLTTYMEHYEALSIEEPSSAKDELTKRVRELENVNQALLTRMATIERFFEKHKLELIAKTDKEFEEERLHQEVRASESEEPMPIPRAK